MTEATQPVAQDAPAAAPPAAPAPDARPDDLESILSQFDQETRPQPQPEPQKPAAQPDPELSQRLTAYEVREEKRDIASAVKLIRGEHEHVSETLVKGWLNAMAEEKPELKGIFAKRYENPAKWEKTLGALAREFAKEQSKMPDKATTEDVAAVTAAIRGASQPTPNTKPTDYSAMSNHEGRDAVRKEFGFDPGW